MQEIVGQPLQLGAAVHRIDLSKRRVDNQHNARLDTERKKLSNNFVTMGDGLLGA